MEMAGPKKGKDNTTTKEIEKFFYNAHVSPYSIFMFYYSLGPYGERARDSE